MSAEDRSPSSYLTQVQKQVLMVCTGNLFRSPMAAAFLENLLAKKALTERIKVTSAGLSAQPGQPAPDFVIEHLKMVYNLDLSAHRSRPLTPILFQNSDLILTMEQAQLMRLAQQYPRYTRKLRLISELTAKVVDVQDVGPEPRTDVPLLASQLSGLLETGFDNLLMWLNTLRK